MSPTVMAAFPNTHTWAVYSKESGKKPEWVRSSTRYEAWTNDQVYHLPPAAKGEDRVLESDLIAQAVPGLEAQRERMASAREGDAWSGGVTIQNDYLRMATDTPNGKAFMWCKSNPLETLRRMVEEYVAGECERAVRESHKLPDPIPVPAPSLADTMDDEPSPKPDAGRAEGVKPPKEIEDHAEEMGWTPESRVYQSDRGDYWIFTDGAHTKYRDGESWRVVSTGMAEVSVAMMKGVRLLPNRRVPAPKPSPGEVAKRVVEEWWDTYRANSYDDLRRCIEAAIVRERNRP